MKIFLTGKNGFLTKNIILQLNNDGHEIGSSSQGDDVINKLSEFRPDIIYHLAVEGFNADKMVDSNILLTHKILEYCRYNPIKKLLVFGSSSEYGRKQTKITEKDLLEPETMYEGTKACATLLSRAYAFTYKIPIVVIRPMSIYGRYDKHHKFIPLLFSNKLKYLNNANHDWTYIDDFVEATIRIMNYESSEFDIVNIGLGVQRTNFEVVKIAEALMNTKIEYTIANGKIDDSMNWVCDPTHLRTKYGYECKTSLEEGLKKYYDWLKNSLIVSHT